MSATAVLEALGSPSMVQREDGNKETWVYDKFASEAYYSRSSGTIAGGLILGFFPIGALGGIGGFGSKASGGSGSTQKTLTVIIKFDENQLVRDFSYHVSKF